MQVTANTNAAGEFVRSETTFRRQIRRAGQKGAGDVNDFVAEPGRYHLYVAYNCPWAHRTIIFRSLKKLEKVISMSAVHPQRTEQGWTFLDEQGNNSDDLNRFAYLKQAYELGEPDYSGRVTVPVLWDKQSRQIVNNESADIIRMLNSAFNDFTDVQTDYYPWHLQTKINAINSVVYSNLNNGVYRAGFAQSQAAYEQACNIVFAGLGYLEQLLSRQTWLAGEQITEADWRLFPTLIRFDLAYYGVFKCNRKRLLDYPRLLRYTRELYQQPGIAETVNVEHIKLGYWRKSERNPSGIIPLGPDLETLLQVPESQFSATNS